MIPSPRSLDSADFNHDGKLDLLVGTDGLAFVMFGNGSGVPDVPEKYPHGNLAFIERPRTQEDINLLILLRLI
jgi:hypothetical protein